REVLGGDRVPDARRQSAAVGEGHGAAAGEPLVSRVLHIADDPAPDEGDDGTAAVVGVDAGAADLHEVATDRGLAGEVELAGGVQAPGALGLFGAEEAVGADGLARGLLPYEQVVAVLVELVGVVSGDGRVQHGAHLLCEDPVPKALGVANVRLAGGE